MATTSKKDIFLVTLVGLTCSLVCYYCNEQVKEHKKMIIDISEGNNGPKHVQKAIQDAPNEATNPKFSLVSGIIMAPTHISSHNPRTISKIVFINDPKHVLSHSEG